MFLNNTLISGGEAVADIGTGKRGAALLNIARIINMVFKSERAFLKMTGRLGAEK